MACASVFLSFHRLNPNNIHKSTRKSSRIKPKPAAPPHLPPPIKSSAGDATSYTRLPPKDDFRRNPSQLYNVIKLSEAIIPPVDHPTLKISPEDAGEESESDGEEELLALDDDDDEGGLNAGDVKEKGVPAVMRCFDRAKIYVKSGDGGDGAVAFRREKYVPFGGPSGGDGGRGGDVYVEVDGSMNSLLSFRKNVHFRAGRGRHGLGRRMAGGKGEDVVVKVAPGTVVRECGKGGVEGGVLLEMLRDGERALVFAGGRGGRGNASFKSGMRKAPRIAENGEAGAEMLVCLFFYVLIIVCFLGGFRWIPSCESCFAYLRSKI